MPPWARLLLRLGVAAGMLGLAVRVALGPHGQLGETLVSALRVGTGEALLWFGLAWAILGVGLVAGAVRFQILLRGAALAIAWARIFRAYLVATFFNLVLPGAVLGDVYRVVDARGDTGRGSEVLGLIALERLLSLAALAIVGLAAAPSIPGARGLPAAVAGTCALLLIATLAALRPSVNAGLRTGLSRISHLAPRLFTRVDRALAAVAEVARQPGIALRAFGLSLIAQVLPVAAVLALAVPLEGHVPWYWFAVIVPFVSLVSLIPVSAGGTGVREVLYVSLFGAVGMPAGSALALALSVLAAALLWGLVGLFVFATAAPR